MKRSELLKLSADAKKILTLPFKVRKERKRLESSIIDWEEKILTLDVEINDAYAAEDIDVENVLDKIDEKELAERRLKQGQELMKELYD